MKTIIQVAINSDISIKRLDTTLISDIEAYRGQECEFKREDANCKPREWWSKRTAAGPLTQVALRFADLRASSANIERTFSVVRGIEGLNRAGFVLTTLRDIARLKINLKDSNKNYLDDSDFSNHREDCQSNQSSRRSSLDRSNEDLVEWTEDQELQQTQLYRSIMKYFDFDRLNHLNAEPSVPDVASQERIDQIVRRAREVRNIENRNFLPYSMDVDNEGEFRGVGSNQMI